MGFQVTIVSLIKEMEKLRNINKAPEECLNIQENEILDLRKN